MIIEILIFILVLLLTLQFYTQKRPANFPPGPLGIPILGALPFIKLPVHKGFTDLSKKYGQIFSVYFANYPAVVINDLKLIKQAFKEDAFTNRPDLRFMLERSWGEKRGIVFGEGHDWQEQRRFALKNLRDLGFGKGSMEALITDEVVDLVNEFKNELNQPVSIRRRFQSAVINSLWHLIAGERFSHDDPQLNFLMKNISEELSKQEASGPVFFMPWLTKLFPNATGWNSFIGSLVGVFAFLDKTIESHKESFNSDNLRDFIDVYIQEIKNTTDEKSRFYGDEGYRSLKIVLLDFFAAGSDTTSNTLAWVILYLIRFPNIQKKLQEEIDEVVGSGKLPSLKDRPKMVYTEAFIAETLRKSSITPLGIVHAASETVTFQDYTIPKGTMIIGNIWHVHHDETFWEKPEEFMPERFIGEENGQLKKENLNSVLAFSSGKRACLGESLARDTLFLFITGLLQQLNFEAEENVPPPTLEANHKGLILTPQSYNVIMTERINK